MIFHPDEQTGWTSRNSATIPIFFAFGTSRHDGSALFALIRFSVLEADSAAGS
jgi:hypothetical protein